jgi:hypothetical protein
MMARSLSVLINEDSDSASSMDVLELEKAGYTVIHETVETVGNMKTALNNRAFDFIIRYRLNLKWRMEEFRQL